MAAASSSSTAAAAAGSPYRSRFGDTTQTKVFVGGLAWETPSEGLRQHFEQYGDILEAVVITDRLTGRSKGYGFVTFREAEAARQAVQDPNPMITGRRANCNIASLGPPRPALQQQQPRGRAPAQLHYLARPPHQPQMPLPPLGPPAIYHPSQSQYGYWYPPEYEYQQAMRSPQVLHSYYAQHQQLYGLAAPYHHQYVGYMPATPTPRAAAVISPAQQLAAQPYVPLQSTAHIQQGSFLQLPSLPHNLFALQLPPPHAVPTMLPPSATDLQSAYSAASATSTSNTHHQQGA